MAGAKTDGHCVNSRLRWRSAAWLLSTCHWEREAPLECEQHLRPSATAVQVISLCIILEIFSKHFVTSAVSFSPAADCADCARPTAPWSHRFRSSWSAQKLHWQVHRGFFIRNGRCATVSLSFINITLFTQCSSFIIIMNIHSSNYTYAGGGAYGREDEPTNKQKGEKYLKKNTSLKKKIAGAS